MDPKSAPECWGWDPVKHGHYSEEVQDAIKKYYYAWERCYVQKRASVIDTICRQQGVQDAFHKIVQLRRAETGVPTYLAPEEYIKAVQSLQSSTNA